MSFVAAPVPTASAPCTGQVVEGDGWYPDVEIPAFRAAIRVGEMVTDARAREALIGGMVSVGDALIAWRADQEAAGFKALDMVPGPTIGGEQRATVLWRRAVYAFAAADLAETHSDIGATDRGRDRRETRAASADDHRRVATLAIRDLLGRGRAKVALV